jgi:hypothetical protein
VVKCNCILPLKEYSTDILRAFLALVKLFVNIYSSSFGMPRDVVLNKNYGTLKEDVRTSQNV